MKKILRWLNVKMIWRKFLPDRRESISEWEKSMQEYREAVELRKDVELTYSEIRKLVDDQFARELFESFRQKR